MNEELRKLYDAYVSVGSFSGTYEEFGAKYGTEEGAATLYKEVSNRGWTKSSQEEFVGKYFSFKKKEQSEPSSGVVGNQVQPQSKTETPVQPTGSPLDSTSAPSRDSLLESQEPTLPSELPSTELNKSQKPLDVLDAEANRASGRRSDFSKREWNLTGEMDLTQGAPKMPTVDYSPDETITPFERETGGILPDYFSSSVEDMSVEFGEDLSLEDENFALSGGIVQSVDVAPEKTVSQTLVDSHKRNVAIKFAMSHPSSGWVKSGRFREMVGEEHYDAWVEQRKMATNMEQAQEDWASTFGTDDEKIESAHKFTKLAPVIQEEINAYARAHDLIAGQMPYYMDKLNAVQSQMQDFSSKEKADITEEDVAVFKALEEQEAVLLGKYNRRAEFLAAINDRNKAMIISFNDLGQEFPLPVDDDSPYYKFRDSFSRTVAMGINSSLIGEHIIAPILELGGIDITASSENYRPNVAEETAIAGISFVVDSVLFEVGGHFGVTYKALAGVMKMGRSGAKFVRVLERVEQNAKNLMKIEGMTAKAAMARSVAALRPAEKQTFQNLVTIKNVTKNGEGFAFYDTFMALNHPSDDPNDHMSVLEHAIIGYAKGLALPVSMMLKNAAFKESFDRVLTKQFAEYRLGYVREKGVLKQINKESAASKSYERTVHNRLRFAGMKLELTNYITEATAFTIMGYVQRLYEAGKLNDARIKAGQEALPMPELTGDEILAGFTSLLGIKAGTRLRKFLKVAARDISGRIMSKKEAKYDQHTKDEELREMVGEVVKELSKSISEKGIEEAVNGVEEPPVEAKAKEAEGGKPESKGNKNVSYGPKGKIVYGKEVPEQKSPHMRSVRVKTEQGLVDIARTMFNATPDQASAVGQIAYSMMKSLTEKVNRGLPVEEQLSVQEVMKRIKWVNGEDVNMEYSAEEFLQQDAVSAEAKKAYNDFKDKYNYHTSKRVWGESTRISDIKTSLKREFPNIDFEVKRLTNGLLTVNFKNIKDNNQWLFQSSEPRIVSNTEYGLGQVAAKRMPLKDWLNTIKKYGGAGVIREWEYLGMDALIAEAYKAQTGNEYDGSSPISRELVSEVLKSASRPYAIEDHGAVYRQYSYMPNGDYKEFVFGPKLSSVASQEKLNAKNTRLLSGAIDLLLKNKKANGIDEYTIAKMFLEKNGDFVDFVKENTEKALNEYKKEYERQVAEGLIDPDSKEGRELDPVIQEIVIKQAIEGIKKYSEHIINGEKTITVEGVSYSTVTLLNNTIWNITNGHSAGSRFERVAKKAIAIHARGRNLDDYLHKINVASGAFDRFIGDKAYRFSSPETDVYSELFKINESFRGEFSIERGSGRTKLKVPASFDMSTMYPNSEQLVDRAKKAYIKSALEFDKSTPLGQTYVGIGTKTAREIIREIYEEAPKSITEKEVLPLISTQLTSDNYMAHYRRTIIPTEKGADREDSFYVINEIQSDVLQEAQAHVAETVFTPISGSKEVDIPEFYKDRKLVDSMYTHRKTSEWVGLGIRSMISEAAEKGIPNIVLPDGKDVAKSVRDPNNEGLVTFYNEIVSRQILKELKKFDPEATMSKESTGENDATFYKFNPETAKAYLDKTGGTLLYQSGKGIAKAAVRLGENGNHVIKALTNPDVTSPLHELAHIFETVLAPEERNAVLDWAGHIEWTRETSEAWARGFERYIYEGVAPTEALEASFKVLSSAFKDIYKSLDHSPLSTDLRADVRKLYDGIVASESDRRVKLYESKMAAMNVNVRDELRAIETEIDKIRNIGRLTENDYAQLRSLREQRDNIFDKIDEFKDAEPISLAPKVKRINGYNEDFVAVAEKVRVGDFSNKKDIKTYTDNKEEIDDIIDSMALAEQVALGKGFQSRHDFDLYSRNREFIDEHARRRKERVVAENKEVEREEEPEVHTYNIGGKSGTLSGVLKEIKASDERATHDYDPKAKKLKYTGSSAETAENVARHNARRSPFNESGEMKQGYMKHTLAEIFKKKGMGEFLKLIRKHADKTFIFKNVGDGLKKRLDDKDFENHIKNTPAIKINAEQFRKLAEEAGVELPKVDANERLNELVDVYFAKEKISQEATRWNSSGTRITNASEIKGRTGASTKAFNKASDYAQKNLGMSVQEFQAAISKRREAAKSAEKETKVSRSEMESLENELYQMDFFYDGDPIEGEGKKQPIPMEDAIAEFKKAGEIEGATDRKYAIFDFASAREKDLGLVKAGIRLARAYSETNGKDARRFADFASEQLGRRVTASEAKILLQLSENEGSENFSEIYAKVADKQRSVMERKFDSQINTLNQAIEATKAVLGRVREKMSDSKDARKFADLFVKEVAKRLPKGADIKDIRRIVMKAADYVLSGSESAKAKFSEIVARTIEDVDYARRLNLANAMREKIHKKLTSGSVPLNYQPILRRLLAIDPSELNVWNRDLQFSTDVLEDYNSIIAEVLKGFGKVTVDSEGNIIDKNLVAERDVNRLTSFYTRVANENIFRRLRKTKFFHESGFTETEMRDMIFDTASYNEAKKRVRLAIKQRDAEAGIVGSDMSESEAEALTDTNADRNGATALLAEFVAEKAAQNPEFDWVSEGVLKMLSFSRLQDLRQIIDNYEVNGVMDGIGKLREVIRGYDESNAWLAKTKPNTKEGVYIRKSPVALKRFMNFNHYVEALIFGKMVNKTDFPAAFGYTELQSKMIDVDRRLDLMVSGYNELAARISKDHGIDVFKEEHEVAMQVWAHLSQPPANAKTSKEAYDEWLKTEKYNIKKTANFYRGRGHKELADAIDKVYTERVEALERAEDFELLEGEKVAYDHMVADHLGRFDFLNDAYKHFDGLELSVGEEPYTALSMHVKGGEEAIEYVENLNKLAITRSAQKSGNFIERVPVRQKLSGDDGHYNLIFSSVQKKAVSSMLRDVNIRPTVARMNAFMKNPKVQEVISDYQRAAITEYMNEEIMSDDVRRNGKTFGLKGKTVHADTSKSARLFSQAMTSYNSLLATIFFGNPIVQSSKQSFVLANLLTDFAQEGITPPSPKALFKDFLNEDAKALVSQFPIGSRDVYKELFQNQPSGLGERAMMKALKKAGLSSFQAREYINSATDKIDKLKFGNPDAKDLRVLYGLRGMDRFAAQGSWLQYYKLYMEKELGVDTSSPDFYRTQSQNPNMRAAAYANMRTVRNHNVNVIREGSSIQTDNRGSTQAAKMIVIPFTNFLINKKVTMLNDMVNVYRGLKLAKDGYKQGASMSGQAVMSLAGHAIELGAFNAFGVGLGVLTGRLVQKMFLDDERKKMLTPNIEKRRAFAEWKKRTILDAIPFVVGEQMSTATAYGIRKLAFEISGTRFDSEDQRIEDLFENTIINERATPMDIVNSLKISTVESWMPEPFEGNMLGVIGAPVIMANDAIKLIKAGTRLTYTNDRGRTVVLDTQDASNMRVLGYFMLARAMGLPTLEANTFMGPIKTTTMRYNSYSNEVSRWTALQLEMDKLAKESGVEGASLDDIISTMEETPEFDIVKFAEERGYETDLETILKTSVMYNQKSKAGTTKAKGDIVTTAVNEAILSDKKTIMYPQVVFDLMARSVKIDRGYIAGQMALEYYNELPDDNAKSAFYRILSLWVSSATVSNESIAEEFIGNVTNPIRDKIEAEKLEKAKAVNK